jgi:hypothetical protein
VIFSKGFLYIAVEVYDVSRDKGLKGCD